MVLFLPVLLVILALLPKEALGRWAAVGGATVMLAIFALTLDTVLGPTSDTSFEQSNWEHFNDRHALLVALLIGEATGAVLLAAAAVRPPDAAWLRVAFGACAIGSMAILVVVLLSFSN